MKETNVFSEIFKYLAISIMFTFIGLVVGNLFVPTSFIYMANRLIKYLMIGLLIMAIIFKKGIIPRRFSMNFVYLFTFIEGVLMYPLINYYLYELGIGMVIAVLIATIVIFASLSIFAKNNETSNIFNYEKILMFILFGIIVGTIVNIFLKSSVASIIISIIGILLFSIYIIYDINLIKRDIQYMIIKDKDDLSYHVLNLYVDFINILLDMLNISSKLND